MMKNYPKKKNILKSNKFREINYKNLIVKYIYKKKN